MATQIGDDETQVRSAAWYVYQMHAWPAFIIIDKSGHVRFRHIGEVAYDTMKNVIKALLTEPAPATPAPPRPAPALNAPPSPPSTAPARPWHEAGAVSCWQLLPIHVLRRTL